MNSPYRERDFDIIFVKCFLYQHNSFASSEEQVYFIGGFGPKPYLKVNGTVSKAQIVEFDLFSFLWRIMLLDGINSQFFNLPQIGIITYTTSDNDSDPFC